MKHILIVKSISCFLKARKLYFFSEPGTKPDWQYTTSRYAGSADVQCAATLARKGSDAFTSLKNDFVQPGCIVALRKIELDLSCSTRKRSMKRFRNALCPILHVLDGARCQSKPQERWFGTLESGPLSAQSFGTHCKFLKGILCSCNRL
jgi:hypothetical protein